MTLNNAIQKTGYPPIIFSDSQPPYWTQLEGQIWINSFHQIHILRGENWVSIGNGSQKNVFRAFNDCFSNVQDSFFGHVNTGTATGTTNTTGEQNHPGILALGTGTTATGASRMSSQSLASIILGGNNRWFLDCCFRLPTLSNATDSYSIAIGFFSSNPVYTNGVSLRWSHSANSGFFTLLARKASVSTENLTSISPVANAWYRISLNVYNDFADMYINGNFATSVNSNIPNLTGQEVGYGAAIVKTVGTATRSLHLDYIDVLGLIDNRN